MLNNQLVVLFVVLFVVWWFWSQNQEGFDSNTVEFVPYGCPRHGLRGEQLQSAPADRVFIRPDRQMRLNHTSGLMWEANHPPSMDGIPGCRKVGCPTNTNEYDNMDSCYTCGSGQPTPMVIPDIHPHVKN